MEPLVAPAVVERPYGPQAANEQHQVRGNLR